MTHDWLTWAQQLQAIAQTGLTFAQDPYDRERYIAIRDVAAAMVAARSEAQPQMVKGLFEQQSGYATPKVDVRAAVFKEGKILLVKERADGLWTLPGGWADVGDMPSSAVEREVREESGYEVRAVKLAAVYDRNRHNHPPQVFHAWKLFFLCELIGGAARTSLETDGAQFFAAGSLPPLSLGRVTPGQIVHMFEHLEQPDRPTYFD